MTRGLVTISNSRVLRSTHIFFCDTTALLSPRPPSILRFRDHPPTHPSAHAHAHAHARTHTHTHTVGLFFNEWTARLRGHCLHNTLQTQVRNIYALSGIRTRHFSNQEAANLGLRLHRHWDRLDTNYWINIRLYGYMFLPYSYNKAIIRTKVETIAYVQKTFY